ncbi:hypothetical protein M405DRAFT_821104 [Rhizopogon salebrosus TDB-379]|nr:hypothetical protein M405DRAFT_821104 [Rhizopogon salebrosus TDB-379]
MDDTVQVEGIHHGYVLALCPPQTPHLSQSYYVPSFTIIFVSINSTAFIRTRSKIDVVWVS